MPTKKQGSLSAPRPSRKNIVITPHKGGRTERFEARLTPAEKQAIKKVIQESGLSSADWLVQVSSTANTACT
jgi:phosphoglycerate dehydrogenase-like enzyme